MLDPELYDAMFAAIESSPTYRRIVQANSDLPDWVVPLSVTKRAALEDIAALLELETGQHLVDLGCGNGSVALWFAQQYRVPVTGVDFSRTAIASARTLAAQLNANAVFVQHDIRDVAFALPAACGDRLFSIDVVQFVRPGEAAAEISCLLRRGGRAVVRTWEILPGNAAALATMVHDYEPVFARHGLSLTDRRFVDDAVESAMFYEALLENAEALRAEMGSAAAMFIEEAQHMRVRRTEAPRVQKVLLTVAKTRR